MRLRCTAAFCVTYLALVGATHGAPLSELIEEIRRVERDATSQAKTARANGSLVRTARLKQAAIDQAIAEYGINADGVVTTVHYTPHGNMRDREGATVVDADHSVRVLIGDGAFRSAGWLASTIAHEVEVHVARQIGKGARAAPDEQTVSIHEIQAYDHEVSSQTRFGLSAAELQVVRRRRAAFYRILHYENRRQVDAGKYSTW